METPSTNERGEKPLSPQSSRLKKPLIPTSNKMKPFIAITFMFLLASCSECETKECWDAKTANEAQQAEIRARNEATKREYELAKMKAEAEIEKAKPESVRLQEVKNQETTTGEGIETATKVAAGVYIGAKIIDIMAR